MSLKIVPPRPGRSRFYRLRGTVRGIPVDETTKVENRDAAEQIRIRREAELLEQSIYGKRLSVTFAEAAVIHMEAPGASIAERRLILPLVDQWGHLPCRTISQEVVDAFIRVRYVGRSAATIVRSVITPLTAILNRAARRGWCDVPRFERPKIQQTRRRWLDHDSAWKLIDAAAPHLKPLLAFLFYTGARPCEALDLDWLDVDLSARWLVFRRTKRNDEDRGVPLHTGLVAILAKLPHRWGRVFLTQRGKPYADKKRVEGGQIKTGWRLACQRAALEGITPYSCRHSFRTWLMLAGVLEEVSDELMGHSSTKTGRIYAHVPRQALLDAIDRLPFRAGSVEYGYPPRRIPTKLKVV